jgi:DNA-binding helix-hairpin-helix protein with protein kinase domain
MIALGQLRVSRQQADISESQTALMKKAAEAAELASSNELRMETFRASLEVLAAVLINYDHAWTFTTDGRDHFSFRLREHRRDSDRRIVIAAGQELREAFRKSGDDDWRRATPVSASYPHDFIRVRAAIIRADEAYNNLGAREQELSASLEINRLRLDVDSLFNRDPQSVRLATERDLSRTPGAFS